MQVYLPEVRLRAGILNIAFNILQLLRVNYLLVNVVPSDRSITHGSYMTPIVYKDFLSV
jgi:hypothetical protein